MTAQGLSWDLHRATGGRGVVGGMGGTWGRAPAPTGHNLRQMPPSAPQANIKTHEPTHPARMRYRSCASSP